MCTCLIAGRRASRSGYALLAANDDWDDTPALLTHVPRQKHAPDAVYTLVGGHTIPEIGETCGYLYTACKYEIGTLDRAWAGGTNDRNVSVAGTGVMAFKAIPWEGMVLEPEIFISMCSFIMLPPSDAPEYRFCVRPRPDTGV